MCVCMAGSLCCTEEIGTTLYINYNFKKLNKNYGICEAQESEVQLWKKKKAEGLNLVEFRDMKFDDGKMLSIQVWNPEKISIWAINWKYNR